MVTVRDASTVTKRNQAIAANSYYSQWTAATNAATPLRGVTSPGKTGAESLIDNRLGGEAAILRNAFGVVPAPDANGALYPANRSTGGAHGLSGQS